MLADPFDESASFEALARSGARVLLIGRRALVVLGLPVLTADYDLWVHIDDIECLNRSLQDLDSIPNRAPDDARRTGRYVLENSEHVDVLVARSASTRDSDPVAFEDVWSRRNVISYDSTIQMAIPSIDDLILTKRWSMRHKDVADIRMLEELKRMGTG